MNELIVATRSGHKMQEIRSILAGVPDLAILDLDAAGVPYTPAEEGLEPFESFEENARSKAEYFHSRTGRPTVADDSGLMVDALGGVPGVRSKRFAPDADLSGQARDDANNRHLVHLLEGVPAGDRTARYVCVAAVAGWGDHVVTVKGEAEGSIVDAPRGAGGFGYDPHFLDRELGRTFAELSADEKNARSHRGKAFRALAPILTQGR